LQSSVADNEGVPMLASGRTVPSISMSYPNGNTAHRRDEDEVNADIHSWGYDDEDDDEYDDDVDGDADLEDMY
jgi:hypothetical protein